MSALAPARRRSTLLGLALVALVVATALATLTMGRLGMALTDLPSGIIEVARGEATGKARFVLGHLRGPRLLVALGAGAALGASGALFQSVTRNPLGSPDVIGVSAGAGAGAGARWERLIVTWRGPMPDGVDVPEPDEGPEPGA